MRASTLGLAAGSAALILAGPAAGTLTGIEVVAESHEPGLVALTVYAQFSDPTDHLLAVCGTANAPLDITVAGGTFYQHPFGTDIAPLDILLVSFPSLAWDTFVTIGMGPNQGGNNTNLMPPWPGFGSSSLSLTDSGWFITPDDAQGAPDKDGRVMLGVFTYDGDALDGSMLVQFTTGGVAMQASVRFCHGPPGPCVEGDLDGNNLVTIEDFLVLLGGWGACAGCPADIDGDDEVGIQDFLILLGNWTTFSVVPTDGSVDADLNRDGIVNVADLLILIQCHGPAIGDCAVADIDQDGSVGAADLVILLANWGQFS